MGLFKDLHRLDERLMRWPCGLRPFDMPHMAALDETLVREADFINLRSRK